MIGLLAVALLASSLAGLATLAARRWGEGVVLIAFTAATAVAAAVQAAALTPRGRT